MNGDELFRYFKLYNQGHFEDTVDSYCVEDAYFWNTRITLCGRQKIIDWLYASRQGYLEKLTGYSVVVLKGAVP